MPDRFGARCFFFDGEIDQLLKLVVDDGHGDLLFDELLDGGEVVDKALTGEADGKTGGL